MSKYIFTEENHEYQFDFSKASWATDEIHDIFHENNVHWNDADFVAEYLLGNDKQKIKLLFVEYKNANIKRAIENQSKTKPFNAMEDKKINNVARKYIDTLSYLFAVRPSSAEKKYVYILEAPNSDKVTRNLVREKIMKLLPFQFQKVLPVSERMIDTFEVLSIEEWNQNEVYKNFPISKIEDVK